MLSQIHKNFPVDIRITFTIFGFVYKFCETDIYYREYIQYSLFLMFPLTGCPRTSSNAAMSQYRCWKKVGLNKHYWFCALGNFMIVLTGKPDTYGATEFKNQSIGKIFETKQVL